MVANLQMTVACDEWKPFYFYKKNSLQFIPKGLTDNKTALVQVMARRWTNIKPFDGAMIS